MEQHNGLINFLITPGTKSNYGPVHYSTSHQSINLSTLHSLPSPLLKQNKLPLFFSLLVAHSRSGKLLPQAVEIMPGKLQMFTHTHTRTLTQAKVSVQQPNNNSVEMHCEKKGTVHNEQSTACHSNFTQCNGGWNMLKHMLMTRRVHSEPSQFLTFSLAWLDSVYILNWDLSEVMIRGEMRVPWYLIYIFILSTMQLVLKCCP